MIHLGDITKIDWSTVPPVDCVTGGDAIYKVYLYSFPDGKMYVGMTKNTLEERRDMGYNHNKPLQSAIRKYGWRGFKHEIVRDGLTKNQAEEMEICLIEKYQTTNPEIGYNISHGGAATFAGLKHTDDYKKHMSEVNTGKVFSAEHKRNLKIAREKTSTVVSGKDCYGNETIYKSLCDAARAVNGHPANISRATKSG